MTVYHAKVHREGKWWVAEVEDVGVTQGRSIKELGEMVRDLVVVMEQEASEDDVQLTLEFVDLPVKATEARRLHAEAQAAETKAAALYRDAVKELIDKGLTGSDAAEVLGVSKQRVSQLVKA